MRKYLIIYQSDKFEPIVNCIKSFKRWARIKNRVWCISTDIERTIDVRERFISSLSDKDLLMVIDITNAPWAAVNLPENAVFWLKEK